MLSRGLVQTAAQIEVDLRNLGARIEAIQQKADHTVARANQNTARIQDQLGTALSKIDDLENRSRHYNFRIRGLLETVKDVHSAVCSFIKELLLDISSHRLQLKTTKPKRSKETRRPWFRWRKPRWVVVLIYSPLWMDLSSIDSPCLPWKELSILLCFSLYSSILVPL